MRVDLKGIHTTHATLADGRKVIYHYAWRNGPRLRGEPGSPEYIASFNEAVAKRDPEPKGTLQYLIDWFQITGEFRTLRERTKGRLHQANRDHRAGLRRLSCQGSGRENGARRV
jgi:hypothetical protein